MTSTWWPRGLPGCRQASHEAMSWHGPGSVCMVWYSMGVAYERAKASAKAADENKSCSRGDASVRVPVIVGLVVCGQSTTTRKVAGRGRGEGLRRAYPSCLLVLVWLCWGNVGRNGRDRQRAYRRKGCSTSVRRKEEAGKVACYKACKNPGVVKRGKVITIASCWRELTTTCQVSTGRWTVEGKMEEE